MEGCKSVSDANITHQSLDLCLRRMSKIYKNEKAGLQTDSGRNLRKSLDPWNSRSSGITPSSVSHLVHSGGHSASLPYNRSSSKVERCQPFPAPRMATHYKAIPWAFVYRGLERIFSMKSEKGISESFQLCTLRTEMPDHAG